MRECGSRVWYERRHTARDTKLIVLVTSPRGSGIYGRPGGNGRANCSSGRKRNGREKPTLFVHLPPALRPLRPENYRRNFDRTPVFSALREKTLRKGGFAEFEFHVYLSEEIRLGVSTPNWFGDPVLRNSRHISAEKFRGKSLNSCVANNKPRCQGRIINRDVEVETTECRNSRRLRKTRPVRISFPPGSETTSVTIHLGKFRAFKVDARMRSFIFGTSKKSHRTVPAGNTRECLSPE